MKRLIISASIVAACVASSAGAAPARCLWGELPLPSSAGMSTSSSMTSHSLAIVYAVPTNVPYDAAVHARIRQATRDVLAWYQCASGGRTWAVEYPETVRVHYAARTREYYRDNGNWWGSLLGELGAAGYPIWTPGKVAAIWAHGAGWWAGAAQWCGVDCGVALLGVEAFPEFNNPAYSGGSCPGGVGVAAWPCTPEGAYAHELGHTVGLPHPADVPATAAVAGHSVMQTHWNYPIYAPPGESPWGFLTLERQTLHANPFMKGSISLEQTHDCPIVNLPASGAPPTASFTWSGSGTPLTLDFTNTSTGASQHYWTFGDGSVSSLTHPSHAYAQAGSYTVKLRTVATNGMMAAAAQGPTVDVSPAFPGADRPALALAGPSPFAHSTKMTLITARAGEVEVTVHDAAGRHVATLTRGYRPAGVGELRWSGLAEGRRQAAPGVYLVRARCGPERATLRVVKLE